MGDFDGHPFRGNQHVSAGEQMGGRLVLGLLTLAALTALYRPDQLKGHTERALANGVTKEEIGELITHLAFYAGWPSAMSAARVAKQVFEERKA